jgi:hypothetical protein
MDISLSAKSIIGIKEQLFGVGPVAGLEIHPVQRDGSP